MGFVGRNMVFRVEYDKSSTDRYYLKITIKQNPQTKVLVIMKNPSKTCLNQGNGQHTIYNNSNQAKCSIDRTTGRVLRKLMNNYDEITIINLYSYYGSNPTVVNKYYYGSANINNRLLSKNNSYICRVLRSYSGDVICAWGKNNGINKKHYDSQIKKVKKMLQKNPNLNLLEYDATNRRFKSLLSPYPLHGLMWK